MAASKAECIRNFATDIMARQKDECLKQIVEIECQKNIDFSNDANQTRNAEFTLLCKIMNRLNEDADSFLEYSEKKLHPQKTNPDEKIAQVFIKHLDSFSSERKAFFEQVISTLNSCDFFIKDNAVYCTMEAFHNGRHYCYYDVRKKIENKFLLEAEALAYYFNSTKKLINSYDQYFTKGHNYYIFYTHNLKEKLCDELTTAEVMSILTSSQGNILGRKKINNSEIGYQMYIGGTDYIVNSNYTKTQKIPLQEIVNIYQNAFSETSSAELHKYK